MRVPLLLALLVLRKRYLWTSKQGSRPLISAKKYVYDSILFSEVVLSVPAYPFWYPCASAEDICQSHPM
jgi:hypothetical protein